MDLDLRHSLESAWSVGGFWRMERLVDRLFEGEEAAAGGPVNAQGILSADPLVTNVGATGVAAILHNLPEAPGSRGTAQEARRSSCSRPYLHRRKGKAI